MYSVVRTLSVSQCSDCYMQLLAPGSSSGVVLVHEDQYLDAHILIFLSFLSLINLDRLIHSYFVCICSTIFLQLINMHIYSALLCHNIRKI